MHDTIVRATASFARECLAGRDASHDFAHAQRVQKLAREIALTENELAERAGGSAGSGGGRDGAPSPARKRARGASGSAAALAEAGKSSGGSVDVLAVELAAKWSRGRP